MVRGPARRARRQAHGPPLLRRRGLVLGGGGERAVRVDWRDAKASLRVIDATAGLIRQLEAERKSLDPDAISKDTKRVTELASSLGGLGFGFSFTPYISIARYHGRLAVMMKTAFVNAQAAIQAVLDLATAELAARRSTTLLDGFKGRLLRPRHPLCAARDHRGASTRTRPSSRSARARTSSCRSTCSRISRARTDGGSTCRATTSPPKVCSCAPTRPWRPGASSRSAPNRSGSCAASTAWRPTRASSRPTQPRTPPRSKAVGGDGLQAHQRR